MTAFTCRWTTLTFALAAIMAPIAAAQATSPTTSPAGYVLADLNSDGIPPLLSGVKTKAQWEAKRESVRRVWLEYIGGLPPRVPVNVRIISETPERDHVRQKIVYATVHGDEVPAYLLIPNAARESKVKHPAIIALHPTNAPGKDSIATPQGRANRMYGLELVSRGYIVLAPDALTSGERIYPGLKEFRDAPFYKQHPQWTTVAKNITDHMQGVDVLAAHDLVDADRIGAIGHSFGAYNAYFLAGADDRIKAVVASCGFLPFTGNKTPGHWGVRDWYTHLPRITDDLKLGRVPFDFTRSSPWPRRRQCASTTPRATTSSRTGGASARAWSTCGTCTSGYRPRSGSSR